jgi:hypothetical protein
LRASIFINEMLCVVGCFSGINDLSKSDVIGSVGASDFKGKF